jgi:predicted O-linked N-acetylglucosamine transferase (SPINDLY family)
VDLAAAETFLTDARDAQLAGDPHTAIALLGEVIQAFPSELAPRYWLASALLTADDPQAPQAMDDARTLHALATARDMGVDPLRCQQDPDYADIIATETYGRNLVAISGVFRSMSLSARGVDATGLLGYALAMQHQGRVEEACQLFALAADNFPSAALDQFQIFPQLFCDNGQARHAAAAGNWVAKYARPVPSGPHANPERAGRKLRIGYVAPNFAASQLKQFITPLLENHDPQAVSVTLYPNAAESETGWPDWIEVHPIGQLSDAEAAALIRADRIDVLADCWGHTAGSRLPVFAHKPAPVQIGWLNFVQTTGLEQIDYVPHAGAGETPFEAEDFVERIWPIGPVHTAFRPATGRLDPVATPALATGQVTLGSFNHPAKLSEPTLDAWAGILRQAPNARLLLKYSYFADPVLQQVTQARFAARGVEPERIIFAGHSRGAAYFEAFREVDLMLDAWPAPGSTTTLDALSNGVPVLVMATHSVGGDCVRAILQSCGLPQLVAADADDYVARALDLIADPAALDALRARVRPGFDGGPFCDEAGFTRRVERAFGAMFDLWRSGAARKPGAR